MKEGAPQIFDGIPSNLALDWPGPIDDASNVAAVDEIHQQCRACRARHRRASAHGDVAMETRGGTASFDAKTGRYTLRVCSQGAGPMRDMLAAIMGIDS